PSSLIFAITWAIWSDSAREPLMASPRSFMSCFRRGFTANSSYDWMPARVLQFYSLEGYADFRATISKMAEISNVKNALQTIVKKDRFLNAAFAGGKSLVVSVGRVVYAFWLQTTGLMFVLFTGLGIADLVRQYHKHNLGDHKRLVIVGLFTI